MTETKEALGVSDFKERKIGLVVFGILEILLGGLCALMVPLMLFGMMASSTINQSTAATVNVRMMIPGILFYALLAVWFIWMGIGSIKARRWARALILVSSWIWLIIGIVGLIILFILAPNIYGQMAQGGQVSQRVVDIMKLVTMVLMTIIYIIIPGVLILFYGSKHVKATCEFRDSQVRWTDRCPLPVLALSLIFGFGAFSMISVAFYGWVVPFFGIFLSGITGAGVVLVITLLLGSLAWGIYKLKMIAWQGAVALTAVGAISIIMTFSRVGLLEFYKKMNFPAQQTEIMQQSSMLENFNMALYTLFWAVGFLGYLFYARRYFIGSSAQERIS